MAERRGNVSTWLSTWDAPIDKTLFSRRRKKQPRDNSPVRAGAVVATRPQLPISHPQSASEAARKARPVLMKHNISGEITVDLRGRPVQIIRGKAHLGCIFKLLTPENSIVLVSGKMPFVDKAFEFNMRCRQTLPNGRLVYEIIEMLDPPFTPLPVGGMEFRKILREHLKYAMEDATRIAMQVSQPYIDEASLNKRPQLQLATASIPIDYIFEKFSSEDWFHELGRSWKPVKYKNFPLLSKFWSQWELQDLHLDELEYVATSLRENPMPWFLKNQSESGLSVIPLRKAELLPDLLGVSLSETDRQVIAVYNAICKNMEDAKTLVLDQQQINSIAYMNCKQNPDILKRMIRPAKLSTVPQGNYDLITLCWEPGHGASYYLKTEYRNKQTIKRRLTQLLSSDPRTENKHAKFTGLDLNPHQQACLDLIVNQQNVILIVGDAGTGKTYVGNAIYRSFPPKTVLPLAMYGEVANKMRRVYGKGMTIDMALERIRHRTKLGTKLRDDTEVIIIDEIGVVTEAKFAALLALFVNLKKIIMMGDHKQLRPVAPGPILDILMECWSKTMLAQQLTLNRRNEGSALLLNNFHSYIRGDVRSIQYTNEYGGDHPFHIIQRVDYPPECIFPQKGELALHHKRMELMKKELEPIHAILVAQGRDMRQVRLLAQRGEDVRKLNEAWFDLEKTNRATKFDPAVFHPGALVCFQCNMNFRKHDWTRQIACSPVSNNTTARIKEIYDINPRGKFEKAYAERKVRTSSNEKSHNGKWIRVIAFEDGTQINLRDYPVRLISHGYATTVASAIGSECAVVIFWIQPEHRYVYRETLYTAMTRASEEVYIICAFNGDAMLNNSDIGWIYRKPSPPVHSTLGNYIPHPDECGDNMLENLMEVFGADVDMPPGDYSELDLNGLGFELSDDEASAGNNVLEEEEDEEDINPFESPFPATSANSFLPLSKTETSSLFSMGKQTNSALSRVRQNTLFLEESLTRDANHRVDSNTALAGAAKNFQNLLKN